MLGWVSIGAIAIFSIGEMLSSPKFSEFIGNFAPHDKKAMYLGFSQLSYAIGWTLEGKLGLTMYEHLASKDRFSRELLADRINDGAVTPPGAATLEELAAATGRAAGDLANVYHKNAAEFVAMLPQGEAFDWLVTLTRQSPDGLTDLMYATHNVAVVWYVFVAVGVISALGMLVYGKWLATLRSTPEPPEPAGLAG
jgi:hypothetical protein